MKTNRVAPAALERRRPSATTAATATPPAQSFPSRVRAASSIARRLQGRAFDLLPSVVSRRTLVQDIQTHNNRVQRLQRHYRVAKVVLATVAIAIVGWNVVLLWLQLWPNESANWLMGTAGLDDGNFWLFASTSQEIDAAAAVGAALVVFCQLFIVLVVIFPSRLQVHHDNSVATRRATRRASSTVDPTRRRSTGQPRSRLNSSLSSALEQRPASGRGTVMARAMRFKALVTELVFAPSLDGKYRRYTVLSTRLFET